MKNIIFVSLSIILFISNFKNCNNEQQLISIKDCNALIVGDTVFVYNEPGISLNRTEYYNIMVFAEIKEKTSQRIVMENAKTTCDKLGYYWYKIETPQGISGWVYGKHIFKFITDMEGGPHYVLMGKKFYINSKDYYFGIARDVSYPVKDENGLSGCNDYFFPFFFTPDDDKIYPIKFNLELSNEKEKMPVLEDTEWLTLENSNNVIDVIEDIEIGNQVLLFLIHRKYSDETIYLNLTAEIKDNCVEIIKKKVTYE